MAKSPDAFRTISEVADWLGIQAHVLRFWESKFTQIKPIKRAGGRRYYRPSDMQLLGGIKKLLHDDGLTIKGVQKILREEGMNHVAAMSAPLDELTASQMDNMPEPAAPTQTPPAEPEKGVVLSFESAAEKNAKNGPEAIEEQEPSAAANQTGVGGDGETALAESAPANPSDDLVAEEKAAPPPATPERRLASDPETSADVPKMQDNAPAAEDRTEQTPEPPLAEEPPQADDVPVPDAAAKEDPSAAPVPLTEDSPTPTEPHGQEGEAVEDKPALPAFLRRPLSEDSAPETSDNTPPKPVEEPQDATAEMPPETAPAPEPEASEPATPEPEATESAPRPRVLPPVDLTAEQDIAAVPATLSAAYRLTSLSRTRATRIEPLVGRLIALRDSMAASRRSSAPPPSNT